MYKNQISDFSKEFLCLHPISIMHTFNFLIAAISTAAIAKPLPDAQTGSSFGYFPSNFGAEGKFFTPLKSRGKNPPFSSLSPLIQTSFNRDL